MGKKIIVVGDSTTHGGTVISGSAKHTIMGKGIARLGDKVDCPKRYPNKKPHGVNAIVEGDGSYLVDGKPVALEGHKTECGCALIGSMASTQGGPGGHAGVSTKPTAAHYLLTGLKPPNSGAKAKSDLVSSEEGTEASQDDGFIPLPQKGDGYYIVPSTSESRLYGTPKTIKKIQEWSKSWMALHPSGPRIGVNDISFKDGAPMAPHQTHRNGLGVDVRPMRSDGVEGATAIFQSSYSRELTKELFELLANDGDCRVIYFNDTKISHSKRRSIPGHDNHLHVEVNP